MLYEVITIFGRQMTQRSIGLGQVAVAQVDEGRQTALLHIFKLILDLHYTPGMNMNGLMRLIQGQYVQDIAVAIGGTGRRLGQIQLPGQDTLPAGKLRGQPKILSAVASYNFV